MNRPSKKISSGMDWRAAAQHVVMGAGMFAVGASLFTGLVVKRVFGDKKPPTPTKSVRKVT